MKDFDSQRLAFIAVSLALAAGCSGSTASQTPVGAGQDYLHETSPLFACVAWPGNAQCMASVERRTSTSGWTAAQLEAAYNLPSTSAGKGQTVFVVDAYDNPNVASDFATYRSAMGLPAGKLTKYNQKGQQTNYPQGSPAWGLETDLDVEMVSASCPNCDVALVEANSTQWSDIEAAVEEATKLGATIVSNSYAGEGATQGPYDTRGVTFVASAGDASSPQGVAQPAAFDNVVAVGGTELTQAHNKRGYDETPWSHDSGGCATKERKPWWQRHSRYAKNCAGRMTNDVSVVANDVAEYDTYGFSGWISVSGTGAGAGLISGVFALAGNATQQRGGRTFWVPPSHHAHLFKVGKRYSPAGGWGSPDGVGAF